jgi:hypothetical protein
LLDSLRRNPRLEQWVASLEELDPGGFQLNLATGMDLVNVLCDLGVPAEDINPVLARRPKAGSDQWWLVERATALLVRRIGEPGPLPDFPQLTDGSDHFLRYFYVYVFAAAQPAIRAWHCGQRIGAEVSRRTLADLGRQMVHNRRRLGYGGLNLNIDWLTRYFSGRLYQLGRLQFERSRLGNTTGREVAAGGMPLGPGDFALGVHIPDYCGPFDPAACDESFARARDFFPRHFPDEPYTVATCHSWLLDRHLADYLSESSNILAFQRRFTINDRDSPPQDNMFFEFVFGAPVSEIDRVPQDTSLQRAIVRRVRDGHHWYGGVGWCRI